MNRLRLFLGTSLMVAALYHLVQNMVLLRDVRDALGLGRQGADYGEHAVAFEEDTFEEDDVVTNTSDCIDVHPRVKNNSMLHVVFALDRSQIPGVQASIASIVHHSNDASTVTIHVMVQDKWSSKFRHRFGIRPNCSATASASGAVIVLHALEASTIAGAVARVPQSITKKRGALDTMENFARFYINLVLGGLTVVYLDADTIVQSDLRELRDKLTASNRTLGFIKRRNPPLQLKEFLREPACMTVSRKDLTAPRKPRKGLVAALQVFKEQVVQGIKSPEQKDREMLAKLPVSQREELLTWRKLMEKTAYNVGVLVVNLQRWADTNVSKRIETYVKRHNDCGGKLWLGGSQPPLLLAFHDHDNTTANDFITFPAKWNRYGLGHNNKLDAERLKESSVLHWNGPRKPWMEDGFFKQLWRPHYERFFSVFTPPEGGRRRSHFWAPEPDTDDGLFKQPGRPHYERFFSVFTPPEGGRKGSHFWAPEPDTEEERKKAARKACPTVQSLIPDGGSKPSCSLGRNYGCTSNSSQMWARPPCSGVFAVGNLSQTPTLCGYGNASLASKEVGAPADSQVCKRGATGQPSSHCGLMLLTSYFTTAKDWQRGETARADVSQLGHFYRSAMRLGLNVTVIYDELPAAFIGAFETSIFRFHKVTVAPKDKKVGVNDVRYGFFQELVRRHPEWSAVFTVDLFDVSMGMNPCPDLRPGMLYVGVENAKLAGNSWMELRFKQMGGKYMEWYNRSVSSTMAILNCGIIGGLRETMLSFFEAFQEILRDSTLAVRQRGEQINMNMAVLNYLGHTKFAGRFQGKDPVHSKYKSYQHNRTDVWFIHK